MLRFKTNQELESEFGQEYVDRERDFYYITPFIKQHILGLDFNRLSIVKIRRCWHMDYGEWSDVRGTSDEVYEYLMNWFNEIPVETHLIDGRDDGTMSVGLNLYINHSGDSEEVETRVIKLRRWMLTPSIMCVEDSHDGLSAGNIVIENGKKYGHVVKRILSDNRGNHYVSTVSEDGNDINIPFNVIKKIEEEIKQHI